MIRLLNRLFSILRVRSNRKDDNPFSKSLLELGSSEEDHIIRICLNRLCMLNHMTVTKNMFELRIHICREAIRNCSREKYPRMWAELTNELGCALGRLSGYDSDTKRLWEAVRTFDDALEIRTQDQMPIEWAETQGNLNTALERIHLRDVATNFVWDQARKSDLSAVELERGDLINCWKPDTFDVPAGWSLDGMLLEWVRNRRDSAIQLRQQGNLDTGSDKNREMVGIFREILLTFPRASNPYEWAEACNDLGVALCELGNREGNVAWIEEAVQRLRDALLERTHERGPVDWALTQMNLGMALSCLGEREAGTARLEEAVAVFRQALLEFTREGTPYFWALTQCRLGNALVALGSREAGTARLEEAVAATRLGLLNLTRERTPHEWAVAHRILGLALEGIGNREIGTATLEEALVAFRQALLGFTRERAPRDWASTQYCIGRVLNSLGPQYVGLAQETVAAFRQALLEFTRDRAPWDWAHAQNGLGTALLRLGAHGSNTTTLVEAIAIFRQTLLEFTRERSPSEWALTQMNLGMALSCLGEGEAGTARLEEAVAAFRAALLERTRDRVPLEWMVTLRNLVPVLLRLEQWPQAIEAAQALLDGHFITFSAARTIGERRQLLTGLGGMGDALALALLRSNLPDSLSALRGVNRGRAVTMELSSIVNPMAGQGSAIEAARAARNAWLDKCDVAVSTRRAWLRVAVDEPGEQAPRADAWRRAQAEVEEAFEQYQVLLAASKLGAETPPANIAEVLAALPEGGVLVVLVVTPVGSAAILVRQSRDSIDMDDVVRLDGLTTEKLDRLLLHREGEAIVQGWFAEYGRFHDAIGGARGMPDAIAAWNTAIATTLGELWRLLMGPIHAKLEEIGTAPDAEIVIMPPGRLSVLPLHAARDPASGRCFVDHWTVSYIPSLQALLATRRNAAAAARQAQTLLAVTDPLGNLGAAENPAWGSFDAPNRHELKGSAATIAGTVTELPRWTYLSFYCHGGWNPGNADDNALVLAAERSRDGRIAPGYLTARALRQLDLPTSRLAVLAACETGLIDLNEAPDEFIGLPASFLQAGVPGVLASLWPVSAHATHELVRTFFELHLDAENPLPPAAALRKAQLRLRTQVHQTIEAAPREVDAYMRGSTDGLDGAAPTRVDHADPFYWAGFSFIGA